MSDIVRSHPEHVEKKEEFCAAIQCHADIAPWWVQWQTLPPSQDCNPEEDICSEEDSAQLTTPIYPQGVCYKLA